MNNKTNLIVISFHFYSYKNGLYGKFRCCDMSLFSITVRKRSNYDG